MRAYNVHPEAREEFDAVFDHYLGIDPELADEFDSTFFRCLDAIIANPLLFNIRRRNTRRVNLTPRFGEYHIAYMIWREQVVILAIAHAKRRPYYWRKRIGEAKGMF
jgi:plasmid stabilization system protein ParE